MQAAFRQAFLFLFLFLVISLFLFLSHAQKSIIFLVFVVLLDEYVFRFCLL
jgi:hypothetical protein